MRLSLSELRKIYRGLPAPKRAGEHLQFLVNEEPSVSFKDFTSPLDFRETGDLRSEWIRDPGTHAPKLAWVLRGKFEIVLDLDLTRSKSVLP